MSRRRVLMLAVASLCAWAATGVAAADTPTRTGWPTLPVPPDARRYWVAESLEQNGLPMRILGFESALPMPEVLRFFERWLADKQGVTRQPRGAGWLMGARLGDYQVALSFQPAVADGSAAAAGTARVVGTLSAARLGGPSAPGTGWRTRASAALPLPPGTTLLSDTQSSDAGKRNRVLMATNAIAVEANTLYLREHLIARGWTVSEDRTLEPGQRSLLTLRRQQGRATTEALITVVRQPRGMMIVASLTTGGATE